MFYGKFKTNQFKNSYRVQIYGAKLIYNQKDFDKKSFYKFKKSL